MAASAKTKNPKVGQATTKILKSFSGGKTLSLTDTNGQGLRINFMWIISNLVYILVE